MSQMITSRIQTCKLSHFCACSHAYTVHLSSDNNKKHYSSAYQKITKFIPSLKKFILANRDSDPVTLHNLIE